MSAGKKVDTGAFPVPMALEIMVKHISVANNIQHVQHYQTIKSSSFFPFFFLLNLIFIQHFG